MVGLLSEVYGNMEKGVYNLCQGGKCVECGECCSALLPISEKEINDIKKYIKKNKIKPHRHMAVLSTETIDMLCPFLDMNKDGKKCDIYEVRPKICREFICCKPPSKVEADKEMFWRTRKGFYMWDLFKGGKHDKRRNAGFY